MMLTRIIGVVSVVILPACIDSVECADGTVERGGECHPGVVAPPPACGPGTHFDFALSLCVPDLPPTRCDENSTETVVDENGVAVCVGNAPIGCDLPLACPSPASGKVSVCGKLIDLETGERIMAADANGIPCGEVTEDGPCSLKLELFDALAFAANPSSEPLAADEIVLDDCGRYKAVNVDFPFGRTFGVAVDDADGTFDDYALTGVAFVGESGQRTTDLDAYAAALSTIDMWTDSGEPPFAPTTFAEEGVYVAIFEHGGARVEGVRVTAGGSPRPSNDYYFSDTTDLLTTVDSSLTATGPNGAALLVNSSLGDHGGLGGEVDGCNWESALATSIPGAVFVQLKHLVDDTGERCP